MSLDQNGFAAAVASASAYIRHHVRASREAERSEDSGIRGVVATCRSLDRLVRPRSRATAAIRFDAWPMPVP
jgi:hypothetical protein